MINYMIYFKLFNLSINLNDNFIKIIKRMLAHDLCNTLNFNVKCMIFNKNDFEMICKMRFFKKFQNEIIINNDFYLLY